MVDRRLTRADYVTILEYYNIDHTNMTYENIKDKAQDILGKKMCRCIKKIQKSPYRPQNESRAIAICRDSVLKKKNLKTYTFKCKQKYKLLPRKNTRRKLTIYKTKPGPLAF